jgi:hypothetical protein
VTRGHRDLRHALRSTRQAYDSGMPDLGSLLPLLVPLLVVQVVLFLLAVYDLFREERRVRWFSKPVWACIILLVNVVGPLAYFFFGREDV